MPGSTRYTCFLASTYFTFLCSSYLPLQSTLILCHKLKRKSHIFACLIYVILLFEFHEVLVRLKNQKFDQNHDPNDISKKPLKLWLLNELYSLVSRPNRYRCGLPDVYTWVEHDCAAFRPRNTRLWLVSVLLDFCGFYGF